MSGDGGVEMPRWFQQSPQDRALKGRKPRLKNVVAAFAAAPLGGASVVAAIALMLAAFLGGPGDIAVNAAVALFILTSILGYVVAGVLGIPGYLLFRRLGWIRRAHWVLLCAVLGSAAGAVWPVVALLSRINGVDPVASIGGFAVAGLLVGTVSGFVFAWIIKVEAPGADEIAATFD